MPLRSHHSCAAALLSAICLGFTSGAAQTSPPAMPKANEPVVLTEKDNGSTVQAPVGSQIVVRLQSQLSTGYGWEIEKIDAVRLLSLGPPSVEVPENQLAGQHEFQLFKFQLKGTGEFALKLQYVRPWDKPLKPAKTFSVKIKPGSS
jgi:predicted secreted protein